MPPRKSEGRESSPAPSSKKPTSKPARAATKNAHGLTLQQDSFATLVAAGKTQSDAYRSAYPTSNSWPDATVWSKASTLAAHGKVRERIQGLMAEAAKRNEITVERVEREIARLAFFDIRRLVDDSGAPKKLSEIDEDTARALVGLDVASVGNAEMGVGEVLRFKLGDKKGALELLGRRLGMFERDNKQKGAATADAVSAFLSGLTSGACRLPFTDGNTKGGSE